MGAADGLAWLELHPLTGRTHQIRVHCAALGCPVLGDPVYRPEPATGAPPLHLHSRGISLPLYPRRGAVSATAPVPPHMQRALAACGLDAARAESRQNSPSA
jgi:23S rRNA-/tRNA-specific pseudouridylate synthase